MKDLNAPSSDPPGMATDEEAARRAREQYRESGIRPLPPDPRIAEHLDHGELVLGFRAGSSLGRIDEVTGSAVRDEGPLYITNRRLIHVRHPATSIELSEIEELAMAEDRILVTLVGARGITLDASEPRQLRVLIAAAKAAGRTG